MRKFRVFISSTMQDLQNERKSVADAINGNMFWEAVYVKSFVARSESPREVCLEEVINSHIYIGIFKNHYRHIPQDNNPHRDSVVVLEYKEAKYNQIPTFIFIYKFDNNRERKLKEFIKELTNFDTGHWWVEYFTTDELVRFVLEAIRGEITINYAKTVKD